MADLGFFTRRDFIKGAGAVGALTLAVGTGGCEKWWKKVKERPTRRNIANLPANDPIIQTYRDAVAAMKALPASDGRNWTKQAEIHNNKCVHANWWFLPWHRAYLFNFEAICRKLTGNEDFALPYWNWTTSPSIPAPFFVPGSALVNTTRAATAASVVNSTMVGAATITNILSQTNFFLFASDQATTQQEFAGYGMLEATPHNYIHGFVGGEMGTYMSPLDPIFWCHHNMVECLWVHWNVNQGNPNTNDPAWNNFSFSDFVDGDGNPVNVQVATTLLYPVLSYQFEPCAPGAADHARDQDAQALEKFLREGAPAKLEYVKRYELRRAVNVGLDATPPRLKIEPEAFRAMMDAGAREKAILTVDEVEAPPKQDVFVRVFINKPDAGPDTPISDPHYAGSLAFFCCATGGAHADMAKPKLRYLVDVTNTVRSLNQSGALTADVDITLVPVPVENRPVETRSVTMNRIELGVARF